jgi:beta-N-acetylhexosaminidase
MQSKGLSACAKHYPGLGAAQTDPHHELPVVQKTWKAMKQSDLLPFLKAFEAKVDCVMSSHPLYPEIDPARVPATFSRRIIHDYLRLELGFPGVVLTDDLKMGAISKTVPMQEAVPLAAKAGHDLLLLCSDPKSQREAFDSLLWAYKKKDLKISELEESVERIHPLRMKRPQRFSPEIQTSAKEGGELAQALARGGAEILNDGKGLLPFSPAGSPKHSLLVLFPELSRVARERFLEPALLNPKDFLEKVFSQFGASLNRMEMISIDPNEDERRKIKELAREHELVLFFCWDAHSFRSTRELLETLQQTSRRLVVVLLREPQDREWVLAGTACVTARGFRVCQVEAVLEKIFSHR